mmetsp:Transcript_48366/g.142737  ORF Transcript_48366/g.142737 Transcript_48366/m.142737 type:complete len:232 (-) Transcript_48366:1831-2526(-)
MVSVCCMLSRSRTCLMRSMFSSGAPKQRFRSTGRSRMLGSWDTWSTRRWPGMKTMPSVGKSMPANIFRNVVLPLPWPPTTAITFPCGTAMFTLDNSGLSAPGKVKARLMHWIGMRSVLNFMPVLTASRTATGSMSTLQPATLPTDVAFDSFDLVLRGLSTSSVLFESDLAALRSFSRACFVSSRFRRLMILRCLTSVGRLKSHVSFLRGPTEAASFISVPYETPSSASNSW